MLYKVGRNPIRFTNQRRGPAVGQDKKRKRKRIIRKLGQSV